MPVMPPIPAELAWGLAVALGWLAGELAHRWLRLPRISVYGIAGFALGHAQAGWLPPVGDGGIVLIAHTAFGLILFEFGYRINLRWLRTNPWLTASALLEAGLTFAAVYAVSRAFGQPVLTALLLASLSMSTSPAALLRVVNEQRSSGQVTERAMHVCAIDCVLAVFAFKVIVGLWTFQTSGLLWNAVSNSVVVLAASAALGGLAGVAVPAVLRSVGGLHRDATLAFAIAVIALVATTHALRLSPVLAALTFGIVARHRRVTLSQAQRDFGALGDLLAVALFMFVAATLEWQRVATGLALAVVLIAVRQATKTAGVTALARVAGTDWRKGALTGVALAPMSVFVIVLLEQTRHLGVDLIDQLAALAAMTLLLEIAGPILTQRALAWSGESAAGRH